MEESFISSYVEKCLYLETMVSSTRRMRRISEEKYEKKDLNKVMTKKYQYLDPEERDRLLTLLRRFEKLFNSTLGTWNTKPVKLELKDYVRLMRSY